MSRRNLVMLLALALVVFGVQWGVRWVQADGVYKCQITVESWEERGYGDIPVDQRHIGGIYEGDSGCVWPERCYEPHAGPFTTSLEPCANYDPDEVEDA